MGLGFGAFGLCFRVLGFRVYICVLSVEDLGFRVRDLGCRDPGLGVYGLRFRV
jgi:hypothetical protein